MVAVLSGYRMSERLSGAVDVDASLDGAPADVAVLVPSAAEGVWTVVRYNGVSDLDPDVAAAIDVAVDGVAASVVRR